VLTLRTTSRILRTAQVPALAVALVVSVALPASQSGLVPQWSSLAAMAAPPAAGQFTITDLGALGAGSPNS
jgi:hypothetical protein